jgi:hypothetical protein
VQPVAVKVTDPLPQRELGTPVGATGIGFTVAITSVLGPSQPAALVHETQYEVVVVILGVVKFCPVKTNTPPVAASYHL